MTPADLTAWRNSLGISRAEACRRLGIAPNTWTAYQEGRVTIPRYIALACAALSDGLEPMETKR
jgi:transcriptional regulator with XRE-family HTH domain